MCIFRQEKVYYNYINFAQTFTPGFKYSSCISIKGCLYNAFYEVALDSLVLISNWYCKTTDMFQSRNSNNVFFAQNIIGFFLMLATLRVPDVEQDLLIMALF